MKIKTKIVLVFSSILILLTIGGSLAIYLMTYYKEVELSMESKKSQFEDLIRDIPKEKWLSGDVSAGTFINEGEMIVWKNQKVLYRKEVHGGRPGEEEKVNLVLHQNKFNRFTGPFVPMIGLSVSDDDNELFVGFSFYDRELNESLDNLRLILYKVTFGIITIGTIFIYSFAHFLLKPIGVIVNTMNEITESEELKEIHLKNKRDELGQIVTAFNSMINRIRDMLNRQEQFVSNVSHELKTPITIIEGYAKLLDRWGLEKKEIALESINNIIEETDRMKYGLIDPMLELTSLKQRSIIKETIRLDGLAKKITTNMKMVSSREIEVTGTGTAISHGELVEQIIYIFIDNAIKYSEEKIFVEVKDNFVSVEDLGPGINEEDIPFIFDRFYRGDKERSDKKGVGLGLAIAKESADLVGAKIGYTRKVEGRSTFWIQF